MPSFRVLGPLQAEDPELVQLKGPRHRTVLARLLIARGRVVPVDVLADDVWSGTPPAGALAALRTFIADLRRALEPDRRPRTKPRLLVTTPPGYALAAAPATVDAWRFETVVADPSAPLENLDAALALWRGPAYAEWSTEGWARAEIDRLDELHHLAVERRAAALLTLDRAAEAASDLRPFVAAHPLREEAWRLLALALYRSGRQGDALAALRDARTTLAAELGLDPGPSLRTLEADILTQSPHLLPPPAPSPPLLPVPALSPPLLPVPAPSPSRAAAVPGRAEPNPHRAEPNPHRDEANPHRDEPGSGPDEPDSGRADEPARVRSAGTAPVGMVFGRDEELGRLRAAGSVALVEGEAGAGKTALVEAFAAEADGWTVLWGRAGEHEGAAGTWPWTDLRTARAELADLPGRVLLVAEDLHRADQDTLDLLTALPATVRLVATARDTDPSPQWTAALARLARAEPVRIRLGPLPEPAVAALVREVAGASVGAQGVHQIWKRSGGNPFFARELARLLAAEGPAGLRSVPPGVRDVIRHRLAQLSDGGRVVLRQASVLGRDVDPELLAAVAGAEVVDALEEATRAGFLLDGARFAHDLVRDTVYGDVSAPRRAAWHRAAAEALERLSPDDVFALAYHFTNAATRATAPRAARYSALAAEQAERRNNPHEAARLWRQSLTHDPASASSMLGLSRALALIGHLAESRSLRAAALESTDPVAMLGAFAVPAIWPRNDDEELSARIVSAATAALPGTTGPARARLLIAVAMELRGAPDSRGRRAAEEAYALATSDPLLRAQALNARFLHSFATPGQAAARAALATELRAESTRHNLVTFEVLAHLIALQSACALDDLRSADSHASAADRLATEYSLPVVPVFTEWYAALRLAMAGRVDEAESAYRTADTHLSTAGMPGMHEGLLGLALLSIDRWTPSDDLGPYEPWARPLLLTRAGRRAEARAALRALPSSPHDLLWEARLCLAARAAVAVDDRATLSRLATELGPAASEHAAGSGVLTFGPVAAYLA
ncbi:BTAD domain-containing putative transcriptional regulator [Dactylosporangium sp. NPDC051541]|uniref:BTAD domain-containing putative transcriptional regulator n=1 Tax=Dactylosporangium sp. NPDC051541 TaxID=3363977 RepID=UPI00379786DE